MSSDAVEHPRADAYAPDFGVRVLGEQALRCGQGVVGDDILTTVDVNGDDLPPLGRLDLATDLSLVKGIATLGCLLGGITGLPGRHEVSPVATEGISYRVRMESYRPAAGWGQEVRVRQVL
jgi:hypothetical protein